MLSNTSIIIPVFNSAAFLEKTVQVVSKKMEEFCSHHEIILVDDGSIDNSWMIVQKLCNQFPTIVRGLKHSKNFGQHVATVTGIAKAKYKWVVTFDDDLQFSPDYIPQLVEMAHKTGLAYGYYAKHQHGWLRQATSKISKMFYRFFVQKEVKAFSSFRCFDKDIFLSLGVKDSSFVYLDVQLLSVFNPLFIEIAHAEGFRKKSNYTLPRLFKHFFNMFLLSSGKVLNLFIIAGLGSALVTTLFGLWAIVEYFAYGVSMKGWTSLFVIISFTSGTQLFLLGVIGKYVHRFYVEFLGKSIGFISESVGFDG